MDGQKGEICLFLAAFCVRQKLIRRRKKLFLSWKYLSWLSWEKLLENREQTERERGIWLGAQGTRIGWDISWGELEACLWQGAKPQWILRSDGKKGLSLGFRGDGVRAGSDRRWWESKTEAKGPPTSLWKAQWGGLVCKSFHLMSPAVLNFTV